ncbi:MAG TPA: TrkA C-terminal domain-containing protein, partial [Acidimicrobiales bacterium]|nr:TrkA C-terminal domain-containing protein [Acidimicrobiales bacterium]
PRLVLAGDETVAEAVRSMRAAGVTGAPFTDSEGRFAGIVTLAGLEHHAESDASTEVARLADPADLPVQHSRQLDVALEALTASRRSWVPVVDAERRVVGTLGISDVVRAYRRELQATLSRIGAASELPAPARPGRESHGGRAAGTGSYEVVVEEGSSLDGRRIREAGLPPGAIITTVERAGTVVLPDGRTELKAGDRLALFATAEAATTLGELARRPESGRRAGAPVPEEDGDFGARAPERAAARGRTSPPGGTGEPPAASGS